MEELKLLLQMVSELPQTALWVLVGFWAYKVICVGSIYGVIRLAIQKGHDVMTARKVEYKEIRPLIDGMCVSGASDRLIGQLCRLKGKSTGIESEYIHGISVDWLREAIDAKILDDEHKSMGNKT